jgi:outer membrane usher protein
MWKFATRQIASSGAVLTLVFGVSGASGATAQDAPSQPPPVSDRQNQSGRAVTLTTPLKDNGVYIGDIILTIDADGGLSLSSSAVSTLVGPRLSPDVKKALDDLAARRTTLALADLEAIGIRLTYDAALIELRLSIDPDQRAVRRISITRDLVTPQGVFDKPAAFSGFLTARGGIDHVSNSIPVEHELVTSSILLDGAVRAAGWVLETQAAVETNTIAPDFQRHGTRLIYDDVGKVLRWTVGDLRSTGRSFQTFPELAGLAVGRDYDVLQPTRIAQAGGDRRFRLISPATVEVMTNGRLARRVRLDPGTYDLRDFPFTDGINDVRVIVEDDTGRTEALAFNMFYDRTLLEKDLSEFGFYAGVAAPLVDGSPVYSNDWTYSGWYRHGLSDTLTLGANSQGDEVSHMSGAEATWASPIGVVSLEGSFSAIDDVGTGTAARLTFTRNLGPAGSFNAFAETRSDEFGVVGDRKPVNPFHYEIGLGWSRSFTEKFYGSIDLRYGKGRALEPDRQLYGASLGYQITPDISLDLDVDYVDEPGFEGVATLLSLNFRLGDRGSVRAEHDTRYERSRVDYRNYGGEDVGAWNVNAGAELGDEVSSMSGDATYDSNRAELGVDVLANWIGHFDTFVGSRTSVRAATSIAFADGVWAVGRPIHDSFAIFKPHKSLVGADIIVQPNPVSYEATSGALGPALAPDLSAYTEQQLTIDVPEAEAGYDLGAGVYRLYPPYRSGYRIGVGSEYSLSVFGVLLDEAGAPLPLIGGAATDLRAPEREPTLLFTNRHGRFAASGLRAGHWRFEMNTDPPISYIVEIPDAAGSVVTLGNLEPEISPP